jgi:multiple antibiotic resistance protein
MVLGDLVVEQEEKQQTSQSSSINFPFTCWSGSYTSVMISFQSASLIVTILSILIVIVVTYIVLRLINPIYKLLGRSGSIIFTRIL